MRKIQFTDRILLSPQATRAAVIQLCQEAKKHAFRSVCVNPIWVKEPHQKLENYNVKAFTVIDLPLGASTSSTKAFEAKEAVKNGAGEVDMVLNIGLVKAGDWTAVEADIRAVVEAVNDRTIVKVILEACLLSDEEIEKACDATVNAGADFVKTSTGFSTAGATAHHVALMRARVGKAFGVKASGGIRSAEDFEKMIAAGANRIGASAGSRLLGEKTDGGNDVY